MNFRFLAALVVAPLLVAAAARPVAEPDFSATRFRSHVTFLADDKLQGREAGSRGYEQAAAYVAGQFKALGLKPGGEKGGWYQQVPLRSARLAKPSVLTLTGGDGKPQSWENGSDIILGPSTREQEQDFAAPLIFAGFGLDAPGQGQRDYDGLNVKGKIVVVLSGAPATIDSETAAFLVERKSAMAARRGAIGIVTMFTDPGRLAYAGRAARK